MTHEEIQKKLLDDDGRPCLTMSVILFLKIILDKTMTVLETGSGRSTIWFAEQVKEIISFESNEDWYHGVTEKLKEEGLSNAIVYCDPDYPTNSFPKFRGEFDIVFLDGADGHGDRVAVIKAGHKFVKPGGYLIVDDSYRPVYEEGIRVLRGSGWHRMDFWGYGYKSETPKLCSVWRRPK